MYRIYRYEEKQVPYRHIQLNRPPNAYNERREAQERPERLDNSLARTRRLIKDTLLCNHFVFFCTFTISKEKVSDRYDYPTLKKQLSQFFANYKKRIDNTFFYLFVAEFHKDGAIHFHGCTSFIKELTEPATVAKRLESGEVVQVPNTKHYLNWQRYSDKFGFFSCSRIRDCDKCATYVSKYITKDLLQGFGKHYQLVMKSKGLKKPELVYDTETDFLQIPANDVDNEYCRAAWADENYTARYYQHWTYTGYNNDNLFPWADSWKLAQWKSFPVVDDETGCNFTDVEQMKMMKRDVL